MLGYLNNESETNDALQMHKDGYVFYKSVNGVWLTKEVPPKYLEKVGK